MSEKGVEEFLYTEENVRDEIVNLVFSPNLEYMVTYDVDASIVLWSVSVKDNKIVKYKTIKTGPDRSPLILSNNKLLISFKTETFFSELKILDMETVLDMETPKCTTINPSNGILLEFLSNGNLILFQTTHIYVFTETFLNNTPYTYTSKYRLSMFDIRKGLEVVDLKMDDYRTKILKMDDSLPTSYYNEAILEILIGFINPNKNEKIISELYNNFIVLDKNHKDDEMIIKFKDDMNDEMIIKFFDKSKLSIYSRIKDKNRDSEMIKFNEHGWVTVVGINLIWYYSKPNMLSVSKNGVKP
ncbi:10231_t:CDS:2, partial [Funneliformis mosseae]